MLWGNGRKLDMTLKECNMKQPWVKIIVREETEATNKSYCYFAVFLSCLSCIQIWLSFRRSRGTFLPPTAPVLKSASVLTVALLCACGEGRAVWKAQLEATLLDWPPPSPPSLPRPSTPSFRWHGVLSTGAPSSATCSVRPLPRRTASMACPSHAASRTTTSAPSTHDSWRSSPSAPGEGLSSSCRSIMWVCHRHCSCETPQAAYLVFKRSGAQSI